MSICLMFGRNCGDHAWAGVEDLAKDFEAFVSVQSLFLLGHVKLEAICPE